MNQPISDPLKIQLEHLYRRINYERHMKVTSRHFKLQNMELLLGSVGNPHLDYPVIHVAGTKGKGSVTSLIGSILSHSGAKTGVYTSPHLESINQRLIVNGRPIADDDFASVLGLLEQKAVGIDQQLEASGFRPLTFFEMMTGAMFLHFSRQQVDYGVIEVGLGGRLDSTNVCQPAQCVITNISLDHTRQLGNTISKIAAEKAGIIKQGIPVVCGTQKLDATETIHRIAEERHAPVWQLGRDFRIETSPGSQEFDVIGQLGEHEFAHRGLETSLFGEHQKVNAALAVTAIESIVSRSLISHENIDNPPIQFAKGLAGALIPGRLEPFDISSDSGPRFVLLDIAHNEASIEVMIKTVHEQWPTRKKVLVFAVSKDKDVQKMVRMLPAAFDHVIFTRFLDNPRAESPSRLVEMAEKVGGEAQCESTPQAALGSAVACSDSESLIVVAGSAFLVAEVRPVVVANSN